MYHLQYRLILYPSNMLISEKESCFLLEKDQINPSTTAKPSSCCNSTPKMARVIDSNLQTGKFLSTAKMKLQFFPVNETTRIKLEKVRWSNGDHKHSKCLG